MALVGVIAKELTEEDLAGAARGKIPRNLGGGRFGAKGVPRGFPDPEGHGAGGQGIDLPDEQYHERMKGGADVPAHDMNRRNTGQSTIAHPASLREVQSARAEGGEEAGDEANERMHRLLADMERGGKGLAGAMRRQGVNSREWYPGNQGIHAGTKYGVKTAGIPGRVEAAPYEHRHAEMGEGSEIDDVLDGLAAAHEKREEGPKPIPSRNQRETTQHDQQLSAGANTPNTEQKNRDAPESTGSRRQED